MGYNALIWRAPDDQGAALRVAREEARSRRGRGIPLPRAQGRVAKRKRPSKGDEKDVKKKKMKMLTSC